ncbi:DUF1257 domain-containing protein [Cyanobium sp. HWJ4-Hawea]|uniref:DUF1257 domain-containing protein n=1 Tax=Cyanobium sp. HWJ4-Hawea TaxID=2823713 RepID=UPI0020CE257D|nr:DUF1257 domain-containing protein [Cyanobium sp. HWJ4-Hawea]MCP9809603.1 DUF1257 domain-containing protein [Cyanobium sp. HWJ4-Hawea]
MSHLSILPTVLRDAELLAVCLRSLGHEVHWGGQLEGFAGESEPVELKLELVRGGCIGWSRQADGSLALVGDLQRLSRSHRLQRLLAQITRSYAAHLALHEAGQAFAPGQVSVSA